MGKYSEDIETLQGLISILKSQIERAKKGKMFILPGSTPKKSIKAWECKIKQHETMILRLEREG